MSHTERPVYLFVPAGFDHRDHMVPSLWGYGDLARWLLHQIHMGAVVGREKHGFIPLKAAYLHKFIPDRVCKRIKDSLIENGVIVEDRSWIVGKKSMGYCLGPDWENVRHHRVEVTDWRLREKILTRRDQHEQIHAPEPIHKHILRSLNATDIDFDAAVAWLESGTDVKPSQFTAVELFDEKKWFATPCPYGRFHYNMTTLRSEARGFLSTHGGESLVNLDIRNSQPLFFGLVLKERFGDRMPPDARRYVELCEAGLFYNHLMDQAGIPSEQRPLFKKAFFAKTFFCRNHPETDEAKLFGAEFPNVYKVIREMKAADYTALAKELQRRESDLMLGHVATRIMNALPNAYLATIHDSIVTTPEHALAMKGILVEEFRKAGLNPTVNIEPLTPPSEPPQPKPKRSRRKVRRRR